MKMNKKIYLLSDISILFLLLLLIISLFLITSMGVLSYNKIEKNSSQNYLTRLSTYYLYHKVKEFDKIGGIDIINAPQGDIIILNDNIDNQTYETRIFMEDGKLIEKFSLKGKYDDVEGMYISDIGNFKAEFENDNLIHILFNDSDIYINLLSEV